MSTIASVSKYTGIWTKLKSTEPVKLRIAVQGDPDYVMVTTRAEFRKLRKALSRMKNTDPEFMKLWPASRIRIREQNELSGEITLQLVLDPQPFKLDLGVPSYE